MTTCEYCTHWKRYYGWDPRGHEGPIEPIEARTCGSDKQYAVFAWGSCELASSRDGVALHQDTIFVAHDFVGNDYESYAASLLTHREFGCNQGKEKS